MSTHHRRSRLRLLPPALVLLLALVLGACVHQAQPLVPVPPPGTPAPADGTLPLAANLDELRAKDPALGEKLAAMDRAGDGDGVFTRGDAWAAGEPQLFADLHIHPFMRFTLGGIYDGLPDSTRVADDASINVTTQVTIPTLRRGATNVLFASAYVGTLTTGDDPQKARLRDDFEEAMWQIGRTKAWIEAHPESMEVARSAEDVERITKNGRIAVVLCIEGGHVIRRVEDVDAFFDAGVRMITIAHFSDNALAGAAGSNAAHPENFNFSAHHEPREGGWVANPRGLTELGEQAVHRMVERGMIVDLAHASDRTVFDVLEATKDHPVPMVVSHSASRELHPSERNVSDAVVRAVAERGGVVALTAWRTQLVSKGIPECQAFAIHLRRFLAVAGADHIAVGTDFNGMIQRPRACRLHQGGVHETGVRHVGDMPELLQTAVEHGVPPAAIEGMGANMLRVLRDVQAAASM